MFDYDDIPVNPTDSFPVCSEMSRRLMLKLGVAGISSLGMAAYGKSMVNASGTLLPFEEVSPMQNGDIQLAPGFEYQKIIGFGDPLKAGMAKYDPRELSGEEQKNRFGGSCDFIHFFSDPQSPFSGILCVNNESPEFGQHPDKNEREKAAYYSVGCSVVELKRDDGGNWIVNTGSSLNRRITPDTKAVITGPAAGNDRLKSAASRDGIQSAGTIGNCAGGFTPWGTYLTAEENIQSFFTGDVSKHPEKENMKRFGMNGNNHFFS